MVDLLNTYRPNITALERDIIGYTKVQLVGRSEVCRSQECNLGNLITDAMIHARVMERPKNSRYWTDAPIAFLMGGGKYPYFHFALSIVCGYYLAVNDDEMIVCRNPWLH